MPIVIHGRIAWPKRRPPVVPENGFGVGKLLTRAKLSENPSTPPR
jgi:hypothetical protein